MNAWWYRQMETRWKRRLALLTIAVPLYISAGLWLGLVLTFDQWLKEFSE